MALLPLYNFADSKCGERLLVTWLQGSNAGGLVAAFMLKRLTAQRDTLMLLKMMDEDLLPSGPFLQLTQSFIHQHAESTNSPILEHSCLCGPRGSSD